MKWFYIINQDSDFYKFGVTNNLKKRLMLHQCSNPFLLEIIFALKLKNPFEIESSLKEKYKTYNLRGEWFQLNSEKILEAIFISICGVKIQELKKENFELNIDFIRELFFCQKDFWFSGPYYNFIKENWSL